MQGMMGNYLEKNIQTFIEIQKRLQDQSRQMYGQNPMLNSEAWSEFVKMQGPAIQGLMSRYLEQSAQAFMEMQQQLQNQTRSLFGGFPFAGFPGAGGARPGDAGKKEDGENKG
jgi:polyhydroxyalkanoate synthesis regulator protein